jgi:hypothetical protein
MPSLLDPESFLESFKPDRCPLCFLVHNYVYEHLKSVLDESVTDPSTRESLFKSTGFCRRHAWQAVQQRQILGMAIIYGGLLDRGLKTLSKKSTFWRKQTTPACPLCESEKKRDQSCLQEFIHCFSRSEKLRQAFSERGVLCLPHLEKALARKMPSHDRKSLYEMGKKALEKLSQDLNEFLEKQDYHRSRESLGTEWDAWIRAVRMISGERE